MSVRAPSTPNGCSIDRQAGVHKSLEHPLPYLYQKRLSYTLNVVPLRFVGCKAVI